MCKLGDIIVINKFKDKQGNIITRHSFVVINDEHGQIEGYDYDFVSSVMGSFHDSKHKKHKLSIGSNLEIKSNQIIGDNLNNKEGYIRADDLFYFNKKKIKYKVIAHMDSELLDDLVQLIIKLNYKNKVNNIKTNLY